MDTAEINAFFKGKHVFITGHTGFKGAWLTKVLLMAGAEVTGFALGPPTNPSLFELLKLENEINSIKGDIRDFSVLKAAFDTTKPEIVFHLAAKSLVQDGYANPRETYETNAMGTVNILECARLSGYVKSALNVTTDKVYMNDKLSDMFDENSPLNGADPYANSKSCAELITGSYRRSFFDGKSISISTARAGNAIGGGDFAEYRIIPDCVRAAKQGGTVEIRNASSIRPYQHVLDAISAYLLIAKSQYQNKGFEGSYNIGPDEKDYITTGKLVEMFCDEWGGLEWTEKRQKAAPREAEQLKIDSSKIKSTLGWNSKYTVCQAVQKTVEWTKACFAGEDIAAITEKQIKDYFPNL